MNFIPNKYTSMYWNLIERARGRVLTDYMEEHHVIPTSLGGSDLAENKVRLTAREHYVCHRLLTKMTSGVDKQKMTQAAWTMARTRRKKVKINSRTYEQLRIECSRLNSIRQKGIPRGPMSEEHKQKIREASLRRYQDPAERLKTGLASKGRVVSEETKAKLSEIRKGKIPAHVPTMKGKTHSPETKARMREAWERRRLKQVE
jgi:hypothetical protein